MTFANSVLEARGAMRFWNACVKTRAALCAVGGMELPPTQVGQLGRQNGGDGGMMGRRVVAPSMGNLRQMLSPPRAASITYFLDLHQLKGWHKEVIASQRAYGEVWVNISPYLPQASDLPLPPGCSASLLGVGCYFIILDAYPAFPPP